MSGTGSESDWKMVQEYSTMPKLETVRFAWTLERFRELEIPLHSKPLTSGLYATNKCKWGVELTSHNSGLLRVLLFLESFPADSAIIETSFNFCILDLKGKNLFSLPEIVKSFGPDDLKSGWSSLVGVSQILDETKGYLNDNKCRIGVRLTIKDVATVPIGNGNPNPIQLPTDYSEFLNKETLSDVKILNADDEELYAHKIILIGNSSVFAATFKHETKERVEAKNVSSKALYEMLKFMYSGKIEKEDDIELIQDLLGAADFYQIIPLKTLCENILIANCETENVFDLFVLGETYSCPGLKDAALRGIEVNEDELLESARWNEFAINNPSLASEAMLKLLKVKRRKLL